MESDHTEERVITPGQGAAPMSEKATREAQGSRIRARFDEMRRAWSRRSRFAAISSTRSCLPKILDRILLMGGTFEIRECKIGVHRTDPSYARIAIQADSHEALAAILGDLVEHGASPIHPEDATIVAADIAGAFPDGFYSTTNQATQVRVKGRWITVDDQEMDCGIVVDRDMGHARCIPMARVEIGMPIVVGHAGVRVLPTERSREVRPFGFMNSAVSSEKPKSISVKGWSTRSGPRAPRGRRSCSWAGRRSCTPARRATSPG